MTVLLLVVAGVLGLLVGSFLNVVAYRVPAGLSVVSPASACPGCRSAIRPRDNVPVLSWLLLRGRCRDCAMRIPVRYPAVEALTAVAFVLAALPFASALEGARTTPAAVAGGLELVAYCYLAAISVVLAVIDLDVRRLPDPIVRPAYAVGAMLLGTASILRGDLVALGTAAGGAAGAFLLFWLLWRVGGMGYGDVKLAGVLGLFLGHLGPAPLAVGLFAGFLLGAVSGVALRVAGRIGRRQPVPYGPFLLGGAWIGVLAGEPLAALYLHVTGLA